MFRFQRATSGAAADRYRKAVGMVQDRRDMPVSTVLLAQLVLPAATALFPDWRRGVRGTASRSHLSPPKEA